MPVIKQIKIVWISNKNPIAKGCLRWEKVKAEIIKIIYIIDCKILATENSLNKILILGINDKIFIFFSES